ncbi:MAG: deoxyribose-phosphate aldolase [Armatimonadetes bacterium]|nr:deoxyribose-phosphate aldolase [Armatimonadota bacterium]
MNFTLGQIKNSLDVALLKPTATTTEIEALATTLGSEGFSYMCVNSLYTKRAAEVLNGSEVKVVACVGFPHPTMKTETKVFETEQCVAEGAGEIDMVIDLGGLIAGDFKRAEDDIRAVVKAAAGLPVKVIIETPYLTWKQKKDASLLVKNAGATFVKTCTGASPDPVALYEDIRLIRETIGQEMKIKASGRVGNYFRYASMMEAGANRVGLILDQAREIIRGWEEAQL